MRGRRDTYIFRGLVKFLLMRSVAHADIGPDGLCNLFGFLPFTFGGGEVCDSCVGFGFNHMASMFLAMEHFNARNGSVVKELELFRDCPVKFDMDLEKSRIINADALCSQEGLEFLATQEDAPCAVVGPFDDLPGIELSTIAKARKFPVTTHRGFDIRAISPYPSPYTTQLYPDIITTAEILAATLLRRNRTGYVAHLYALTEMGSLWRETVSVLLDEHNISNQGFSYNSSLSPAESERRTMQRTLEGVKDSGYRTIVVTSEIISIELKEMAQVATDLELTNGNYLWVFMGEFDPSFWETTDNVTVKFLEGSLLLMPLEEMFRNDTTPFVLAWKSQGSEAVKRLNDANPIRRGDNDTEVSGPGYVTTSTPGYVYAKDDYFSNNKSYPDFCSGFLYDAVIATGMGACRAFAANNGSRVPIDDFVKEIRSSDFLGVSGHVHFECQDCPVRDSSSYVWVVMNLWPPGMFATDLIEDGEYEFVNDTIYADGRSVPPTLLRDPGEQNYLSGAVRGVGFALLGVAWLAAAVAAVWVFLHHKHRVVRAAQPYFLYLICLGAAVSAAAIFSLSFDESYGWSTQQLSHACMSIPWLSSLGHIITYGALFSKLWRINLVLQPVRRKIEIKQVLWPSLVLAAATVLILALWTGLDPLEWSREWINKVTGETIGQCRSEEGAARFLVPLIAVLVIPTLMTLYMSWCTKDIDEAYSESYWIFIMVLVQCEVILFAVPMFVLLRDVSTDGRYFGYVILIWTFPMTALALIIGPKIVAFHRVERGSNGSSGRRRNRTGATGDVHVTGLEMHRASISTLTPPTASHADEDVGQSSVGSIGDLRESTASRPNEHDDHLTKPTYSIDP